MAANAALKRTPKFKKLSKINLREEKFLRRRISRLFLQEYLLKLSNLTKLAEITIKKLVEGTTKFSAEILK